MNDARCSKGGTVKKERGGGGGGQGRGGGKEEERGGGGRRMVEMGIWRFKGKVFLIGNTINTNGKAL